MDDSPSPPSPARSGAPPRARFARRGLVALAVIAVIVGLAVVAFILVTRSRDTGPGGRAGAATSSPGRHVYLLEAAGGRGARVSLEVAADEAARGRGLSNREELPAGTGMAFLFPRDTVVAFWMKDTLVPLQIAFVGADGRVLGLFEMPPCRADPCPTYAPERPYRYAVELPQGAFTAAGIREGDRVVPEDPATLPNPT